MASPFPGMDPYIEASGLWEDFHGHLIESIARQLADAVSDRYIVRTGQRSYLVLAEAEGPQHHAFLPDVKITAARGRKKRGKKVTAVAEPAGEGAPVLLRPFIPEEHRETFVEIYELSPEQRLVTSLEVLSLENKRPGTKGWKLYQRKRKSLLLSDANLVELDLLRGGQRLPMLDPWPNSPYTLLVACAGTQLCHVWQGHFRRPLPSIPVPLAKPDPDIPLNIQPLVGAIYRRFRYERSIDYSRQLEPPLSREDAAWLKRRLQPEADEGGD